MFIIRHVHITLLLMLLLSFSLVRAGTAIPNVMGLSLDAAQQQLEAQGFSNYSVQYQPTKHHLENTVMVQAPPPNTSVASDFAIRLIIAKSLSHLKTSVVPNLKGMNLAEAKAALAAVNLQLGHISESTRKMERIQVLYQTPKSNQRIIQQRAINITLSDVVDQDTPRVKVLLDKQHFKVGESTWIKTQTYNVDPNKKSEYGFSINGRTYYSSKSEFQYTFKQAGHYIITASFRYARGTWHASLTRKVKASLDGIAATETASKSTPETITPKIVKPIETSKVANETETLTKAETSQTVVDKQITVPNVIGLSKQKAQAIMKQAKLSTTLISKPHKSKNNVILQQAPKADQQVKPNTMISLTFATKIKPWLKPKAIIHPEKIEVIQGKTALFSSHSTHDKRSKIVRHWSAKFTPNVMVGRNFNVNTKMLKVGKYRIKLTIKDDKNITHKTSALLIIKKPIVEVVKKVEEKEKEQPKVAHKTLSNTELYNAIFDETNHYILRTNSVYIRTLLNEAKLLQPLTYPSPNIATHVNEQSSPYPSAPLVDKQGLELSYVYALLMEAKQTTDQQKTVALSEKDMPLSTTSNKISSSKVQQVENKREQHPNTSLISTWETSITSWHLWLWLALILTSIFALLAIIWSYRCKKNIETLNIVYQYQNDEGKQHIVRKSS